MMINAFMAPMPITGGPNALSQFQQPMAWPTGPGGAGPKGMHGYGVVPSRHDYRGYSGTLFMMGPTEYYPSAEYAFKKYDNLIRDRQRRGKRVPNMWPDNWFAKRARAKAAMDIQKARAAEAKQAATEALSAAGLTNPMVDTPIPGMPSAVPDPTIIDPGTGVPMNAGAGVSGGEPEGPDYTKWAIAGAVAVAAALGLAYATMSKK